MHDFHYSDGRLMCEEVPLEKIARTVGTPFYCYSHRTLTRHYNAYASAFEGTKNLICYSVKANSNMAVLHSLMSCGAGADIVSGGELFRALSAGIEPIKIVYSGVGKRDDEIRYALQSNILFFNVESMQEMEAINRVAGDLGQKARVAIRVNPDVDPKTHAYISTGLKKNKFGIAIEQSIEQYRRTRSLENIEIVGVDCHIGSQLTEISPFVDALNKLKGLVESLREDGFNIEYIDIGGGLGITYSDEAPPHPNEYAEGVKKVLGGLDCTLVLEPGRSIAGNAGVLVSKVLYTKEGENKRFLICDAAMNDLLRPSLYGSFHSIKPLEEAPETIVADVVGPICESGDFLAKDRKMADLKRDDMLAVMSAGAYGFTMSSNYNSRPHACEVLVKGSRSWVVRRRQTYDDLVRGEQIPGGL